MLAFDQETGFGLVQALARLDLPALPIGNSSETEIGERVVVAGAGGRQRAVAARIIAKQEFAGYWEYVLDEAIFTAPAHPNWGGTALIGPAGDLLGIGSLQIQQAAQQRKLEDVNMIVPIDLLKPILQDLLTIGRPNRPSRPWLGLYATEVGSNIAILGLASRGPAAAGGPARRRHHPERCGHAGERSGRPVPARLGAGPGRRRRAAADQPRGQDLRAQHQVVRPPPLPQGAGAALSSATPSFPPSEAQRGNPASLSDRDWGWIPAGALRARGNDDRAGRQLIWLWPPRPSRSICCHQLSEPNGRFSAMNSW